MTDINTLSVKIDNEIKIAQYDGSGSGNSVGFASLNYVLAKRVTGVVIYSKIEIDEFKVWDRALTSTEQTDIHILESNGNSII